jgi:hypothetical protein
VLGAEFTDTNVFDAGGSGIYECDDDTLTVTVTGFPQVAFDRVDRMFGADNTIPADIVGSAARFGDRLCLLGRCCGGGHDGLVFDGGQLVESVLSSASVVGAFDPGDDRDP